MHDIDDVVRRLRQRAARSRGQAESLEWKAADALDQLRRELEQEPAKSATAAYRGTRTAELAQSPNEPDFMDEVHDTSTMTGGTPCGPDLKRRALTLQEAADLLHVSRRTVYEHRAELGFFQVGTAWRVWPEKLMEATASHDAKPSDAHARESAPSAQAKVPSSKWGTSLTAHKASAELDKLLAQRSRSGRKKRG